MASIGTTVLLKIFPALLPPINEEDRDFYQVLDIPQGSTESEIRKAYKLKSLALHPDKIAQRRESALTADEAAKEYLLVQEAHTCLSDNSSRQKYHAVKCSPSRYRFLTQGGGLSNQMALLKNLSQASLADKTRLVLFVSIFPALVLIQPILIAVKVNQILKQEGGLEDASWIVLLIPWWFLHGLFVAFWFGISFMAPAEARYQVLSTAFEHLLWLLAFVLLALRWDGSTSSSYAEIFIPVYFALVMKWLHTVLLMKQISCDMSKMISKDHFLNVILHGREPEELEEEELKELHDKYVVVSQIPADVEYELANDEQFKQMSDVDKEEIRVSSSKEFEAALQAQNDARRTVIKSMVFDVTFLVLLILKVDDHIDMSWWLTFLPILTAYGLKILRSCFICCCLTSAMDPNEAVLMSMKTDLKNKDGNNEAGENPTSNNNNDDHAQDDNQDGAFSVDSEVILNSLKTAEFNDKIGIVKGPLKAGRQEVYILELDKTVALKMANMKLKNEKGKKPGGATSRPKPTAAHRDNHAPSSEATEKKEEEQAAGSSPSSSTDPSPSARPEPDGEGHSASSAADEDREDMHIHIDPETYKAYQSAYAAAEESVMEERVKAGQDNCVTVTKLIMVCLLVAKLEQAYEAIEIRDEAGPVDVGFNTLWLIVPLFLVVGFMIFCCACLIYRAPDPDELMKKEGKDERDEENVSADNNQGEFTGEAPIVFSPPPPSAADEAQVEGPSKEAKATDDAKAEIEEEAKPPKEEEVDINDLD